MGNSILAILKELQNRMKELDCSLEIDIKNQDRFNGYDSGFRIVLMKDNYRYAQIFTEDRIDSLTDEFFYMIVEDMYHNIVKRMEYDKFSSQRTDLEVKDS